MLSFLRLPFAEADGKGKAFFSSSSSIPLSDEMLQRSHNGKGVDMLMGIAMVRTSRGVAMKSFHWHTFLRSHPLFLSLPQAELERLLSDEVSRERRYLPNTVILREGEVSDSLFLMGSGSVQVTLRGTGGPVTPLAVLQRGEVFGEMAVLEQKPRSATVLAKEKCVVLEIAGEAIRKLLEAHPYMQVTMYTLVRDRLRQWFQRLAAEEPH